MHPARPRTAGVLYALFLVVLCFAPGVRPAAPASRQPPSQASPSPVEEPATPQPSLSPSPLLSPPVPQPSPTSSQPQSPTPVPIPPSPVPVLLVQNSISLILGRSASIGVSSPASGLLTLAGFDPAIIRAIFNAIDRTIDVSGLHSGSTTITASDMFGQTATLSVSVQAYAGKAYSSTSATITGDPASAEFVAQAAAAAAKLVAYPQSGARVNVNPDDVRQSRVLGADNAATVIVPLSISGAGYAPYQQDVSVRVINLAQPGLGPKNLLVSDYPETITENGTLFYSDVSFEQPARLLYYHYANSSSLTRRVLVKAQNNGLASSLLELIAGIAGPNPNILAVGHDSTKRFLVNEAHSQGQVFEVPPHATVNVVDQLLPAANLVSGLMQLRVISGSSVRVAVVVQDAADIPVGPISDTLLSSVVRHARGVYSVPDFNYDLSYSIGDSPAALVIGKLPLPNLEQGEVLGGDYGVKQSASIMLLNPGPAGERVGMWFEPRGGRATGTFLIDGQVVQLHPVEPGSPALVRTFDVPANGYRRVSVVTMPEGGSSYPVLVLFGSQAPPNASWNVSSSVY